MKTIINLQESKKNTNPNGSTVPAYRESFRSLQEATTDQPEYFITIDEGTSLKDLFNGLPCPFLQGIPEVNISSEDLLRELQNEYQALDLTMERYKQRLSKLPGSETAPARLLINRLTGTYAEAIRTFINPSVKGRGWNAGVKGNVRAIIKEKLGLTPEQLAFTVLKAVLDRLNSPAKDNKKSNIHAVGVFETIVKYCIQTREFEHFKREAPEELKSLLKSQNYKRVYSKTHLYRVLRVTKGKLALKPQKPLTRLEGIHLGGKLIDLLIESTGAFEYALIGHSRDKKHQTIRPTEATNKILNDSPEIFAFLHPMYPIMVCPPKPWTSVRNGGYWIQGNELRAPFVKQPVKVLKANAYEFSFEAMPKVYEAVNHIQNTPWRINQRVFEVMKALWEQGGGMVQGIPDKFAKELPPKPWGELDNDKFEAFKEAQPELWKDWRMACCKVHNDNHKNVQERSIIRRKLDVAERYKDEEALYFPHYVDFRGRVYPLPSYVTPQSDDSGKALLEFSEGKALGDSGYDWLAIHGANLAGQDKLPFRARLQWAQLMTPHIIKSAENPLEYLWWTEVDDKPFQFLAFCFEWADMMQGNSAKTFVSHLPIAMDGTCNGLQHLSAMLHDDKGGRSVNLTPSETPSDIYTVVLEKTRELIEADISREDCEETDKLIGQVWLTGNNLNRKVVKRPVMTTPYGVSSYGIRDQLREFVPAGDFAVRKYEFMRYLESHLQTAINETVTASKEVKEYLQDLAKDFCNTTHGAVSWEVPLTGFKAIQRYYKQNLKRVDVFQGSQRMQLNIVEEDPSGVETGKQVSGVSPNFIHSLDAAMLMQTVLKAKAEGINSLALIHDSYGTHAADTEKLARLLREAFIDLYSSCGGDVLGDFREQLQEAADKWALETLRDDYNLVLPEPPSRGTLCIYDVMESLYFFS